MILGASRFKNGVLGATVLASLLVSSQRQADAHKRDFPFTVDWHQPTKGEREIETTTRYRGATNTLTQLVELEYGITDRLAAAAYIEYENGPGKNFSYNAVKVEGRYQLGQFKPNTILSGLYLEVEKEKGAPSPEVEGKLILSRYNKRGDNLSFNYIVERELSNGSAFENSYSVGYARTVSKKGTRLGGEWIHNLESGQIHAGPTLGTSVGNRVWVVAGYAFAVNSRGGNKGEARLITEYEF